MSSRKLMLANKLSTTSNLSDWMRMDVLANLDVSNGARTGCSRFPKQYEIKTNT
jgi:hypothetical protein